MAAPSITEFKVLVLKRDELSLHGDEPSMPKPLGVVDPWTGRGNGHGHLSLLVIGLRCYYLLSLFPMTISPSTPIIVFPHGQ